MIRRPHLGFPGLLSCFQGRRRRIENCLQLRTPPPDFGALRRLFGSGQLKFRFNRVVAVFFAANVILAIALKREESIVVLLQERIELVIVALRAAERAP